MSENTHLYVLWTNDNLITAEKMVFMYTVNSLVHGWWEEVTLIIWGATAKLVNENTDIQEQIKKAQDAGVQDQTEYRSNLFCIKKFCIINLTYNYNIFTA